MVDLPPLDHYDLGALVISLVLLFFGYVVYPSVIGQVGVYTPGVMQVFMWLGVLTISVGWMAFFGWKWFFDMEADQLWN